MTDEPDIKIPIIWVGAEELPVLYANQFVAQVAPGEIFLTVGQLTPPALIGTEEEKRVQIENLQYVSVQPIAKLAMTPSKLRELASIIELTLSNYDKQDEAFGDPRGTRHPPPG